jgi:hypothetical protein
MPRPLQLKALPLYEWRLLQALSFFRFNRNLETQARHCLAMYLRQSEDRIMAEVGFYARRLGMNPDELLDWIATDPDAAQAEIAVLEPVEGAIAEDPDFL